MKVTMDQLAEAIGKAVNEGVSNAIADKGSDKPAEPSAKQDKEAAVADDKSFGRDMSRAAAEPKSQYAKDMEKQAPIRHAVSALYARHKGGTVLDAAGALYGQDVKDYFSMSKATHQLTDYVTGGALSVPDFASFIIEGLDNQTVVRRMNPQTIPVSGAMDLPNETDAPDGASLAENEAGTPEVFNFGNLRIDPKRMAVDVVLSNRLIRQSAQGERAVRDIEGYIVRRLRSRLSVLEDSRFLRGTGAENQQLGLFYQLATANTFSMVVTSNATREKSIRDMPTKLQAANIMISEGYFLMSPATAAALETLRDANGNLVYPSLSQNGTLYRSNVIVSTQVLDTEMWFFDGPSIIVANEGDGRLSISTEGSYTSGSTAYGLVQRDETLLHLEIYSDVKLERSTAGARLDSVAFS